MDITHYYLEWGNGYPLILLHGNGEDSSYFCHQLQYFSHRYHVYAIDTRGHGRTERGTMPFTIRQFADDLKGFMDEHEIRQAHILGFSDGGNIAMIFAMKYPERVCRLILDGANLDPSGVTRSLQIPIEIGYYTSRLFSAFSAKARKQSELLGLMVHDPNVSFQELSQISAPTLVIAGTHDLILQSHTEKIAAGIPDAWLRFVEGGHAVANENPEAFNAAVQEFLDAE